MRALFIILGISAAIALTLYCPFCHAGKKKPEPPPRKPELLVSIEKISKGTTMHSSDVRNVTFTLSPMRAFFTISF